MSLGKLLDARSVAVVGASRDEKKRGFHAVRALIESKYEGSVYPDQSARGDHPGFAMLSQRSRYRGPGGSGPGHHAGRDPTGNSGGVREQGRRRGRGRGRRIRRAGKEG